MTTLPSAPASVLMALLLGVGFSEAAAPTFRAVDITVRHDMSNGRIGVSPTASPTLGVKQPTIKDGVAYVGLSREMGQYGVTLSSKVPLRLHLDTEMGTLTADLRGSLLERLDLESEQTNSELTLPARSFSGSLETEMGTVRLNVPANTGVRLNLQKVEMGSVTLGGQKVATGISASGSYASSNYEAARYKIDLTVVSDQTNIDVRMP